MIRHMSTSCFNYKNLTISFYIFLNQWLCLQIQTRRTRTVKFIYNNRSNLESFRKSWSSPNSEYKISRNLLDQMQPTWVNYKRTQVPKIMICSDLLVHVVVVLLAYKLNISRKSYRCETGCYALYCIRQKFSKLLH